MVVSNNIPQLAQNVRAPLNAISMFYGTDRLFTSDEIRRLHETIVVNGGIAPDGETGEKLEKIKHQGDPRVTLYEDLAKTLPEGNQLREVLNTFLSEPNSLQVSPQDADTLASLLGRLSKTPSYSVTLSMKPEERTKLAAAQKIIESFGEKAIYRIIGNLRTLSRQN